MENSAGYLSVVAKIKDLEQQLTLCDVASNECNESGMKREEDEIIIHIQISFDKATKSNHQRRT